MKRRALFLFLVAFVGEWVATPALASVPVSSPGPGALQADPADPITLKLTPYGQEHLLTCEAATVRMMLDYFGIRRTEKEIQAAFPVSNDPTRGYRGKDIDGNVGFENYGAHAPAVAAVVQHFLDEAGSPYRAVWATFRSHEAAFRAVRQALERGSPVIVWMTWEARGGKVPRMLEIEVTRTVRYWQPYPWLPARPPRSLVSASVTRQVRLVEREHVEIVYGMEGDSLYVIDPYSYRQENGRLVRSRPNGFRYTWKREPAGWAYFDYAVVYVVPRS
ncbi:MAG: C39 family peptidase [Chloroflexia bacterium]